MSVQHYESSIESLRRTALEFVGYSSLPYRSAAWIINQIMIIRREGYGGWRRIRTCHSAGETEITLELRSLEYPLIVRTNTHDLNSLIQTVIRQELGQFPAEFQPELIIDAGAYVGDSSAYFLSRFKNARVVGLEPDQDNFQLATKNLALYGSRATVIQAALWDCETAVSLTGKTSGVSVIPGEGMRTITIPTLMARFDFPRIDLLKLNIEGAEETVLMSGLDTWLPKVGMLLVTFHSPRMEEQIPPELVRRGFDVRRFRNVWYCLSTQTGGLVDDPQRERV